MDDNKSPLTPPASTQPIEPPPAPPLDLSTAMPKPASIAPTLNTPPTQKLETPSQSPVEHDIASPTSLPTAQTIPAPESNPAPEVLGATPEAPSPIPSMPAASSIPPMPSLDSLSTAPSPVSDPAPTTPVAPIPDSVINVSAPATNPSTPPIAAESPAPNAETAAPVLATPTASAETKPLDTTQPKKSKALVFVVIFLALVALTLGGLVVWSAMQPNTSSIEESMTPPVVSGNEEVGEITEEEVIVEQPDPTADWEVYANEIFQIKYPSDIEVEEEAAGLVRLTKLASNHQLGTELYDGISLSFETREIANLEPITFAENKIIESNENGLGDVISPAKQTTLNGYDAAEYTYRGLGTTKYTIVQADDNVMFVVIGNATVDPNNSGYSETVDQILSTLSFNSTASSTTPGAALQGSCTQDGETYADGDEVPAPDSCNSCSCENGQIACTAMACEE